MPSHHLNQCWNIVNWNLRNKIQWNLKWNSYISIQENAFENVTCKMAAFLFGLNVLTYCHFCKMVAFLFRPQCSNIVTFQNIIHIHSMNSLCQYIQMSFCCFPIQRVFYEFIVWSLSCTWHWHPIYNAVTIYYIIKGLIALLAYINLKQGKIWFTYLRFENCMCWHSHLVFHRNAEWFSFPKWINLYHTWWVVQTLPT